MTEGIFPTSQKKFYIEIIYLKFVELKKKNLRNPPYRDFLHIWMHIWILKFSNSVNFNPKNLIFFSMHKITELKKFFRKILKNKKKS